jgi:hypothetical protein
MAEFVQQIAAFDAKPVTFHHNVSAWRVSCHKTIADFIVEPLVGKPALLKAGFRESRDPVRSV